MKSIRTKITFLLSATVVIICLSLGIVSCVLNFKSSLAVMEETLIDTASTAANQVVAAIEGKLNITTEIGALPQFTDKEVPLEKKRELIEQKISYYGFSDGGIIGMDGVNIFDSSMDVSNEAYFQAAMRGETYVTEPIPDRKSGKLSILLAAPLWTDGKPGTTVAGMIYFVPSSDFLNNLVNSIHVGENGTAYIIDREGTTIAYNDDQIVQDRYNTQEEAKADPSLVPLAALETRMINGETGFGEYSYGGIKKVMAFSPVAGSNGWSITVSAGRDEFLGGVYQSLLFTIALIAVYLIAGITLAVLFGGRIAKPVALCADRLERLAGGDLQSPVPAVKTRDETGRLAGATDTIVTYLHHIIGDMDWCLEQLAQGDFTVDSRETDRYIGDFQPLLASLRQIINRLSDTLCQVRVSADQVSSGSDQVAAGAQALSQGATEQAASIEELAAAITGISDKIKLTAQNALGARGQTSQSETVITACNQQMQEMITAMAEISDKSSEIGKIIKTIEDIAFQTNILALNAAVEAARAGAAGKGFAVVAEEVRNLANKSQDASKNTSALIEGSVLAVEKGTRIANETAQSLLQVVEVSKTVSSTVDKIASAADEQANSVAQVAEGIDQISSVVQTNSATAEECAAASEELSGQAQVLKELVDRFKLGENGES